MISEATNIKMFVKKHNVSITNYCEMKSLI